MSSVPHVQVGPPAARVLEMCTFVSNWSSFLRSRMSFLLPNQYYTKTLKVTRNSSNQVNHPMAFSHAPPDSTRKGRYSFNAGSRGVTRSKRWVDSITQSSGRMMQGVGKGLLSQIKVLISAACCVVFTASFRDGAQGLYPSPGREKWIFLFRWYTTW